MIIPRRTLLFQLMFRLHFLSFRIIYHGVFNIEQSAVVVVVVAAVVAAVVVVAAVCLFVCLFVFFTATSACQHIANSRGCELRECRKIREIQEVFELRRGWKATTTTWKSGYTAPMGNPYISPIQWVPSWEVTYPPYPLKSPFWRWFSFSPGGICWFLEVDGL